MSGSHRCGSRSRPAGSQVGERGDEFEGKAAEFLKNETLRYTLRAEEAGAISGAPPHLPPITWNLLFHFLNPES
jgi:hypothetical protein